MVKGVHLHKQFSPPDARPMSTRVSHRLKLLPPGPSTNRDHWHCCKADCSLGRVLYLAGGPVDNLLLKGGVARAAKAVHEARPVLEQVSQAARHFSAVTLDTAHLSDSHTCAAEHLPFVIPQVILRPAVHKDKARRLIASLLRSCSTEL